jgi:hypothetical protein
MERTKPNTLPPACPQFRGEYADGFTQSEDCLFATIYTPLREGQNANLPVFTWYVTPTRPVQRKADQKDPRRIVLRRLSVCSRSIRGSDSSRREYHSGSPAIPPRCIRVPPTFIRFVRQGPKSRCWGYYTCPQMDSGYNQGFRWRWRESCTRRSEHGSTYDQGYVLTDLAYQR